MDRWEMEKKIAMKALKDPEFKKKLVAQPKEAVKEFLKNEKSFDLSVLDKVNIKVHEEKRDEWTLSIPWLSSNKTLSDAELKKVAAAGSCGHLSWFI